MQHLKSKNMQNCIILEIQNLYQYIIKYFGNYQIFTIPKLKRQMCHQYLMKTLVINNITNTPCEPFNIRIMDIGETGKCSKESCVVLDPNFFRPLAPDPTTHCPSHTGLTD